MKRKAVVLLSGGLDSAVTLYSAIQEGYECRAIVFSYGQRHDRELDSSSRIAKAAGVELDIIKLDMPWKGSSLLDREVNIPSGRDYSVIKNGGIPSTYVPARNTIFLSMAVSFAEAIGADAVYIGAHSEDSSGYPDCREEYLRAFDRVVQLGTKRGIEEKLRILSPVIGMKKSGIVELGARLGVPFELTWSCYVGGVSPCGECDSCVLRAKGFQEAGIEDPLVAQYVRQ